jgi:AcrR family transcriptional regulator
MNRSHPTKELLIDTTIQLMATVPPDQLTADLILETSSITKGSLYHHFEDFGELLEYAHTRIFSRRVDQLMEQIERLFSANKDRADLLRGINLVISNENESELSEVRSSRIQSIATTISSERATGLMGEEQGRLTAAIADLFRELQERGWATPDLDPLAVSVFVQSHNIGRTVDDFATQQMDPENWRFLLKTVYQEVLFT